MNIEEENLETYFLIWLDNSTANIQKKQRTQTELQSSIHYLKIFCDEEQCENYIQSLTNDDRSIFIVNAQLGKNFIPRIHQLPQITSIYVICVDKSKHQTWANQYKKIKCLVSQYDELISKVEHDQERRIKAKIDEPLSISILDENLTNIINNNFQECSTTIDNDFTYSYSLVNCLVKMKSFYSEQKQLIKLCENIYKENSSELLILEEFRKKYSSLNSLSWLTRNSFIHRLINKAIRMKNFRILFLSRFYFQDIYQELQKHKCFKTIRVYRSYHLSKNQLNLFENSIGKIISINSFFLTNLSRRQSMSYFKDSILNDDHHSILFEIDADPRLNDIQPFANITSLSYSIGEQIVLFMSGSLFRIINIQHDNNSFVSIIQLKLCSQNEQDLNILKLSDQFDFISFGQLIIDRKKFDQAQIYYNYLIPQMSDDNADITICYDALGYVLSEKHQYNSSLKWYEKSLIIKKKLFDPFDPRITSTYNSIASLHLINNNYNRALEFYEKAFQIFQQKYGDDHPRLAECFNNMAMIHKKQEHYRKALKLYNQAVSIYENHNVDNNINLALSYKNVGLVYRHLTEYDLALEYFNRSLKIYESILPLKHSLISMTLENIANIYCDKENYRQALKYYEKAAKIYRHILPSTHPDVLQIRLIIKKIEAKI
ncbi:unnamed protein product [Rotaria sp. Silwood1]|nr:unnamed protein product [Rotaria sp. Silwood1]CAF3525159.1 unnamed protein product [Rotaria sp. Silwood1]CAF4861466.1 unnamed protein product [Rotaria sp. Silwood1]